MADHQQSDRDAPAADDLTTWLSARCSRGEQATLRERIAFHDQRLQDIAPAARAEAVVDALLHDAKSNLVLDTVLRRLQARGIERLQDRAVLN